MPSGVLEYLYFIRNTMLMSLTWVQGEADVEAWLAGEGNTEEEAKDLNIM